MLLIQHHGVLTYGTMAKDALMGFSMIPDIGWIYGGADIASALIFGTSITDAVGNAVDNKFSNAGLRI